MTLLVSSAYSQTLDEYGGDTRTQRKATGYFRVEMLNRRWYFITPAGHPFIALGGNHVEPYLKQEAKQLLARFDNDPAKAAEALLISVVTQAAGYARQ
jgi:hypothetical protein